MRPSINFCSWAPMYCETMTKLVVKQKQSSTLLRAAVPLKAIRIILPACPEDLKVDNYRLQFCLFNTKLQTAQTAS